MKKDVPAACRIKITLRDIRPPIWRRLEIGTNITFEDLHRILQAAMGWTNSHLHGFDVGAMRIGIPDSEWPEDVSEKRVSLRDVLRQGVRRFRYEYDFGDGWVHDAAVEVLFEPEPGAALPRCTAGKRSGARGQRRPVGLRRKSRRARRCCTSRARRGGRVVSSRVRSGEVRHRRREPAAQAAGAAPDAGARASVAVTSYDKKV
ncbi:MAG: plasmid pRiA4b ORF-3 family protein [Acidobacteriota bacterium]